jgi:L-fuconolactonase
MSLVVDAHPHLWDIEHGQYAWQTPDVPQLYRTFDVTDLEEVTAKAGVDATVIVQAADTLADTADMLRWAAQSRRIRGVVGWIPFEDPAAAASALDDLAGEPLLKGVRHLINYEDDDDWLLRPAVQETLGLLAERGLPFDVTAVNIRHLEHVVETAQRHPSLRLVIDHLGKPDIRSKAWEPWAGLIADCAQAPNVFAKVSGLDTAADPESWSADDLRPYVEHALAVFGPDRCMFGSDWPVSTLGGGYQRVFTETLAALDGAGADARGWVMGRTAAAFYRLDLEDAPR